MNINLDIKEDQLKHLDDDLREFFANLNEDQKMLIIQTYFNKKLDAMEHKCNTYLMTGGDKEWFEMAKYLREGIREKVQQAVADKVALNDSLNTMVNDAVKEISPKLEDMIGKAISTYVIQHLFVDKRILEESLENAVLGHIYKDHIPHNN